jgi:hypothetical protein
MRLLIELPASWGEEGMTAHVFEPGPEPDGDAWELALLGGGAFCEHAGATRLEMPLRVLETTLPGGEARLLAVIRFRHLVAALLVCGPATRLACRRDVILEAVRDARLDLRGAPVAITDVWA